jgi:hypothetical protein
MPYDVLATFEAQLKEGVTREQVREAFSPLIDGYGAKFSNHEKADWERYCWFDGEYAGVSFTGNVSWDFKDDFLAAAKAISELSVSAFETAHVSDATMTDRQSSTVFGPTPESIQAFKSARRLSDLAEATRALELPPLAGLAGEEIAAATQVSIMAPRGSSDEPWNADVVATLNLQAIPMSLEQRVHVANMFSTLGRLLNSFSERPLGVFERGDARQQAEMRDVDIAFMALGPGVWNPTTGPETGVGNEMWFDSPDGPAAYVCVDQGQVTVCEIYPAGQKPGGDVGGKSARAARPRPA